MEPNLYSTTLSIFKSSCEYFSENLEQIEFNEIVNFVVDLPGKLESGSQQTDPQSFESLSAEQITTILRPLKRYLEDRKICFYIQQIDSVTRLAGFSDNQFHLILLVLRATQKKKSVQVKYNQGQMNFWAKIAQLRYDLRSIKEFYRYRRLLENPEKDERSTIGRQPGQALDWDKLLPHATRATARQRSSIIKDLCPFIFKTSSDPYDMVTLLESLARKRLNYFLHLDQLLPLLRNPSLIKGAVKLPVDDSNVFPWFSILFFSMTKHARLLRSLKELIGLEKPVFRENLLTICTLNMDRRLNRKIQEAEKELICFCLQLHHIYDSPKESIIKPVLARLTELTQGDLVLSADFLRSLMGSRYA